MLLNLVALAIVLVLYVATLVVHGLAGRRLVRLACLHAEPSCTLCLTRLAMGDSDHCPECRLALRVREL